VMWLVNAEGEVLMQRRPSTGIWALLWTLPQADDAASSRAWFEQELRGDFDEAESLPAIDHAFSHYKLRLQPLRLRGIALRDRVGDNGGLRWVARSELASLGIPAPIRRLLES